MRYIRRRGSFAALRMTGWIFRTGARTRRRDANLFWSGHDAPAEDRIASTWMVHAPGRQFCRRAREDRFLHVDHRPRRFVRRSVAARGETGVEEINLAGGVLGRPVELVVEDNRSVAGESA